jgi:hypothetical protein
MQMKTSTELETRQAAAITSVSLHLGNSNNTALSPRRPMVRYSGVAHICHHWTLRRAFLLPFFSRVQVGQDSFHKLTVYTPRKPNPSTE